MPFHIASAMQYGRLRARSCGGDIAEVRRWMRRCCRQLFLIDFGFHWAPGGAQASLPRHFSRRVERFALII